ncbi:MAG: CoA transferase [Gammaproteobacteria bacterium]|nr:MAG: CoA transferase [Gammaproteobacteria bacterium]
MSRPLEGIRLLDLTHMLSGPYAAMMLADLGCDTVKVEPPGEGEGTRRLLEHDPKHSIHGMGAYYFTLNRNKRSVAIDLKSASGRDFFYELVKVSDVVLDNFSAGVTARLGIDHETLAAVNPRIVTCSVTGFGADGPNCQRPAFDQIVQGLGGGMSITGKGPNDAVRAGIPIGDLGGGMFAVMGVQAALLARERSGHGQHVDISMLDGQISLLNYMATMYAMSGEIPQPIGNSHFVHTPYNTFATADDDVIIAVIGDRFWPPLVDMLDIEALRDPKFATAGVRLQHKAFIEGLIGEALAKEPAVTWLQRLEAARIPCARVNNLAQALSDPQVRHRGMVVAVSHPEGGSVEVPGNPIKLSRDADAVYASPPLLGAHTLEVFREWTELDPQRLEQGLAEGVIVQGDGRRGAA